MILHYLFKNAFIHRQVSHNIIVWSIKLFLFFKNEPNLNLLRMTCDALRDFVQFVQFKKREKHPWKSVNFSKLGGLSLKQHSLMGVFHIFKIVQMVPNRAKCLKELTIAERITDIMEYDF